MSTVDHLSPGQSKDRSAYKRDLKYWIDLAKILERGNINALFLADTYVTKNLAFGITATTTFESPFLLAKRFSTLDHLTGVRIGRNIVTSWKNSAFEAIGIDSPIEHDERYRRADEYLRVLYKLWEGLWSQDAVIADVENEIKYDKSTIMENISIRRRGTLLTHRHNEHRFCSKQEPRRKSYTFPNAAKPDKLSSQCWIFVCLPPCSSDICVWSRPLSLSSQKLAKEAGRDPQSIKFFTTFTPIIGRTDEQAQEKLTEAKKYASTIGGLVLFSGWTGIDISKIPLRKEITADDSLEANKVTSVLSAFTTSSKNVPKWTHEGVAEVASIGGLGPVAVGSLSTVADDLERLVAEADLDGFNLACVITPGTFENVVDLLVPEPKARGLYPKEIPDGLAAREKVYGLGQTHLRDDHLGSSYKYDVYKEDPPYVEEERAKDLGNSGETEVTF